MLGSVVRTLVAPILRECPQACGIVTITRVEISSDQSYATVYISALKEPGQALQFLTERRGDVQSSIAGLERARVPHVRFRLDRREEEGNRIEELLDKLSKNP